MTPSKDLFDFVVKREGLKLKAYQDSKGTWTSGVGHTGPEVMQGYEVTEDKARFDFFSDLGIASKIVNSRVQVPLTQHEFDALVDLTFNIGGGAFTSSTLLKLLNQKNYLGAHDEFAKWDKCGGRVLAGLGVRRSLEAEMFEA